MPVPAIVPDKAFNDVFTEAMWDTYIRDDINFLIQQGANLASAGSLPLPTNKFHKVTGTTTITAIASNGVAGQEVVLHFTQGPIALVAGNNLQLVSNMLAVAGDTLHLITDGTNWLEVSRSQDVGAEIYYGQITGDLGLGGTEAAPTNVIVAPSIDFDGGSYMFQYFCQGSVSGSILVAFYDGSTSNGIAQQSDFHGYAFQRLTPTVGPHTFKVAGWAGTIGAGPGGPGNRTPSFFRITRAN